MKASAQNKGMLFVASFQRDILVVFVHVHKRKKLGVTECKCRCNSHDLFVVTASDKIIKSLLMHTLIYLCVFVCVVTYLVFTCAVSPSTVNVIVGLPLLSNLVDVDEYNHHSNKTDERHQHCRAQSYIDVWDKAPRR